MLTLFWLTRLAALVLLCSTGPAVTEVRDEDLLLQDTDTSDFVDPTDMLSYDFATKSMKKVQQKKTAPDDSDMLQEKAVCPECPVCGTEVTPSCAEFEKLLNVCRSEKNKVLKLYSALLDSKPVDASPYFKRYIRSLMQQFNGWVSQGAQTYEMKVNLPPKDFEALKKYADTEDGNLQDASEVLGRMIYSVMPADQKWEPGKEFERLVGMDPLTFLQFCAAFACLAVSVLVQVKLRLSWSQLSIKLMVLLFILSVPWNWWHLYKKAVAKRHAELPKDIPEQCNPERMSASKSFLEGMKRWFTFSDDECQKYHENILIDPLWEVPPTKAIAVTLAKFFVEPLEHIGAALSKFFKAMLKDMPVQLWPVVLVVVVMLVVLVLVMGCGYRISFLWHVFGIEPPQRHLQEIPAIADNQRQYQALEDQVKQLTERLEAQQHPAIAPAPAAQAADQPDGRDRAEQQMNHLSARLEHLTELLAAQQEMEPMEAPPTLPARDSSAPTRAATGFPAPTMAATDFPAPTLPVIDLPVTTLPAAATGLPYPMWEARKATDRGNADTSRSNLCMNIPNDGPVSEVENLTHKGGAPVGFESFTAKHDTYPIKDSADTNRVVEYLKGLPSHDQGQGDNNLTDEIKPKSSVSVHQGNYKHVPETIDLQGSGYPAVDISAQNNLDNPRDAGKAYTKRSPVEELQCFEKASNDIDQKPTEVLLESAIDGGVCVETVGAAAQGSNVAGEELDSVMKKEDSPVSTEPSEDDNDTDYNPQQPANLSVLSLD